MDCCIFSKYDNVIIGKYYQRTMRNGLQDVYFKGILFGKNGVHPYCFIRNTTLEEFENEITKCNEYKIDIISNLTKGTYLILSTILCSQLKNVYINDCDAYVSRDKYGAYTIGKRKKIGESHCFYETVYIQEREDGVTMKINNNAPFGNPSYHEDSEISSIPESLYHGIKASIAHEVEHWRTII